MARKVWDERKHHRNQDGEFASIETRAAANARRRASKRILDKASGGGDTAPMRFSDATAEVIDRGPYSELRILLDTEAEAQALVAEFPKSLQVKHGRNLDAAHPKAWRVYASVVTAANSANGGANESGLKRWESIQKRLAKLGIAIAHRKA